MKLVGMTRLGRSCPTLLELFCASCDHEEKTEDRPRGCVSQRTDGRALLLTWPERRSRPQTRNDKMSADDYVGVILGLLTFSLWAVIGFMHWFG
jgi:hypothetical protein